MLNYIRSEFFKAAHRKYPYVMLIVLCFCASIPVFGWAMVNTHRVHTDFALGAVSCVYFMGLGVLLAVLVGDIVFSEQYKHNTLKNEVSYGIPRAKIYLGKLLATAILGILMAAAVILFYLAACAVFLPWSSFEVTVQALKAVAQVFGVSLSQWLALAAVANLFYFTFSSSKGAAYTAIAMIFIPSMLLGMFSFFGSGAVSAFCRILEQWTPIEILKNATELAGDPMFALQSWLIGIAWMVTASGIGIVLFQKKEIS